MSGQMFIAIDWYIRERTPSFLRAAGLVTHANALATLVEIDTLVTLRAAEGACSAASSAASSAADSAASEAARSAARSALAGAVTECQASWVAMVGRMLDVTTESAAYWHWDTGRAA